MTQEAYGLDLTTDSDEAVSAWDTTIAASLEHRLIAALKPKEHKGWDAKHCIQCEKAIELTAAICQHCGQEQDSVYMI